MEILKSGDCSKLKHLQKFFCSKCGCEFIANETECKLDDVGYPFETVYRAWCYCPCCKNKVLGDIIQE